MLVSFLSSSRVLVGSLEHVLPITLTIVFLIVLIRYSKKQLSTTQQHTVLNIMGWIVFGVIVSFHVTQIVSGNYNFKTDLPLYLCSFLAVVIPVFTTTRAFWMFEILVFLVFAGTSLGIVTPDIAVGYPSFDYFRYWVVHLGLVAIVVYAISVLKMYPTFKSGVKAFIALQVYFVFCSILNWLLGSNYMYINHKPESASIVDYLGEWPWYILSMQALVIPVFLLVYLPFYLFKKKA